MIGDRGFKPRSGRGIFLLPRLTPAAAVSYVQKLCHRTSRKAIREKIGPRQSSLSALEVL